MKKLLLFLLLICSRNLWAQFPAPSRSFAVTSPCPAGGPLLPSVLQRINTDGSMTPVGTITANGTPLVLNGLGYNNANRTVLYGTRVETPTVASVLNNIPPDLYQVDLATAQATLVGPLTSPATPPEAELTPPGFLEVTLDLRQTLNFVADSDPNSVHYVGGVTFRVIGSLLSFPGSARVTDVRLYVGTVNLAAPAIGPPVWHRLNVSDPATAAIIEDFRAKTQAYVRNNFSGTVPDGGIQDWVFDKASGNLVSYLGQTDQFLTITNPGSSTPVATTTTPAVLLPALPAGISDKNIGAMFSDVFSNVYVVRASNGAIHRVSGVTGDYSGRSFGAVLGCNRGDAVSFADALPLPVTLTRFEATPGPSGVRLSWATASEQQAAYFAVERSATATTWAPVVRVPASNRPNGHSYSALDAAPLPGQSYYRLAMHDADGRVAYSEVRTVNRAKQANLVVYPNPASAEVRVQLPDPQAPADLELLNAQGQVVRRQLARTSPAQLSTTDLPGGCYVLRVRQASATATARVVLVGH